MSKVLIFCLIFQSVSFAGTGVGSFATHTQRSFDFRILRPMDWKFKSIAEDSFASEEKTIESWNISNSSKVVDVADQSQLNVRFIEKFPAKNLAELLVEAKKRNPSFEFKIKDGIDFSGASSLQKPSGASTVQLEYYLVESYKVIQVEVIRNVKENGDAEANLILSTVRRPSIPPKIRDFSFDKVEYRLNEQFCARVTLDAVQVGPEIPDVSFYSSAGWYEYWSTPQIKWDSEAGVINMCGEVTNLFQNGFFPFFNFGISLGRWNIRCELNIQKENTELICGDSARLKFKLPKISGVNTDRVGPTVVQVEMSRNREKIKINAMDPSDIAFIQLYLGSDSEFQLKYVILPTEIGTWVGLPQGFLNFGFSEVSEIRVFDSLGNITALRVNSQLPFYDLIDNSGVKVQSSIKRVSFYQEAK